MCGGEDWEEVQAELDRERRNPTANTPSAPGAAPVRRRPPHPRRRLALEGKGKAGHTLHLPLPGTATAARREPGGRWKVPSPCRGWLQHRSCAGCGPVYLCCGCLSVQRHAPLRGRPGSSCSASCRRVAPCWRQPCRSSSFRRVCSLPDAPSGCGTQRRERLHTPPGWPCHKRRHGNAVTACSVLAVAHYDAGTGSLLPAPPGSAAPLCFLSLLFFPLNVALLIFL